MHEQDSPWGGWQRFLNASKIQPFANGILEAAEAGYYRLNRQGERRETTMLLRTTGHGVRYGDDEKYQATIDIGTLVTTLAMGDSVDPTYKTLRRNDQQDMQVTKVEVQKYDEGEERLLIQLDALDGSRHKGGDLWQRVGERLREIEEEAEYVGEAD